MVTTLILFILTGLPSHVDWTLIPVKCEACHDSHGIPGTKLLNEHEPKFCFQCHGNQHEREKMIESRGLSRDANPVDMTHYLEFPHQHPLDSGCTACHAGHGVKQGIAAIRNQSKKSTRNENQFEHELCGKCHGDNLIYKGPLSSHPVLSPGIRRVDSSSLKSSMSDKILNCSDCHGSDDSSLPKGVHGSRFPSIITHNYQTGDGQTESLETYALCYSCHDRDKLLQDKSFPYHSEHVVNQFTSCYTCHDSHAANTYHLLAIEDPGRDNRIKADNRGRRYFKREGNGGTCFLSCHGVEHDGWGYRKGEPKHLQKPGKLKLKTTSPLDASSGGFIKKN